MLVQPEAEADGVTVSVVAPPLGMHRSKRPFGAVFDIAPPASTRAPLTPQKLAIVESASTSSPVKRRSVPH